jgi:Beta-lactamase superfamily domain
MTMDRLAEKQVQIRQYRDELVSRYPVLWQNIINEWKSPGPDRTWLIYSANYLFRTGNVRWALDPLTLNWRLIDSTPKVDVSDLEKASFILLTHRHKDHLDLDLLSTLRYFPICWVIPEPLLEQVTAQTGISRENIIVPRPLQPLTLNGICITPFDGLHWETGSDDTLRGVPSTGYLIEFNGKRWLFPGDTRTYKASQLPNFGHLDGLFAHLWMGRGYALHDSPSLLEPFCHFFASQLSSRIILTHLMELGREANDFWDISHAQKVISLYKARYRHLEISYALIGQSVLL